jgi:S-DNA-T family DNA segregation ATPase FtsK/SpoIIIE
MVTDAEIERLIEFWQASLPPTDASAPVPWDQMLEEETVQSDRDNLVEQAIAVVRETQRASASLLQRRLRIGYPRAARLIDELEELGIIAASGDGREREVLIGKDDREGE